jgi:hypothetical protein
MLEAFELIGLFLVALVLTYGTIAVALIIGRWLFGKLGH